MNAQHTPGPWKLTTNTTPGQFVTDTKVRDKNDGVICVLHINSGPNARLIASAPELLEALERLYRVSWVELETARPDVLEQAREAIAKARGQA